MDTKVIEMMVDKGWHISDEGYQIISNNGSINDIRMLILNALDSDLKDIGKACLPAELNRATLKNLILQIQKIKNISAAKSNQESQVAPRMLKLILTDGQKYCEAIEINNIPFLSYSNTPLGTKILIKTAIFESGYLLLDSNSCQCLGGKVQSLYEKWELNKSFLKQRTRCNGEGPPPWVNFGQKIISAAELSNVKSMEQNDKSKELSEFDMQRKDAIAGVASGATKKVFGGGIKQQNLAGPQRYNNEQKRNYQPRQERKMNKKEVIVEDKPQKPSEKISLFDFLETKLPNNEDNSMIGENEVLPQQYQNVTNNSSYHPRNSYGRYPDQRNRYTNSLEHKPNNRYSNKQENNHKASFSIYNKDNQNNFKHDQVHHKISAPSGDQNHQKSYTQDKTVNSVTNPFSKNSFTMSVNSDYASRSLRQHLNLELIRNLPSEHKQRLTWKKGDQCMAKYWEDNKYYTATITAVTNRTCVVQFNDYGNIEEVLQSDCVPVSSHNNLKDQGQSAPVDFKRGGNRMYKPNRSNFKSNF